MAQAIQLSPVKWRLIEDDLSVQEFWVPTGSSQTVTSLRALVVEVANPQTPPPVVIDRETPLVRGAFGNLTQIDLAKAANTGLLSEAAPSIYRDNFIFGSTENGEIGELGWSSSAAATIFNSFPQSGRPGILTVRSSSTARQVASLYPGVTAATPSLLLESLQELTWIFQPTTGGSTDFTIRAGLCTYSGGGADASQPTDGIYIEKLAGETNYFFVLRKNGSQSRYDTGKAASPISWTKFNLQRKTNGWRLQLDDLKTVAGLVITVNNSNAPTDATYCLPFAHIIPSTNNSRDLQIDFFSLGLV